MNVPIDGTAPSWAQAFATVLSNVLGRNDARVKALEERIKALEAK